MLQAQFGGGVHFNGRLEGSERIPNTCNVSIVGEGLQSTLVCVCVRACVRACVCEYVCVHACVHVCVRACVLMTAIMKMCMKKRREGTRWHKPTRQRFCVHLRNFS